jgi:hypothetical protein
VAAAVLQAAAVQELVSSGALPDSAADSSCLLAPLAAVMANGLLDLMKGEQLFRMMPTGGHGLLAASLAVVLAISCLHAV